MIIVISDTLESQVEHASLVLTSAYPAMMEVPVTDVMTVSLLKVVSVISIKKHLMDNFVLHRVFQLTILIMVTNFHTLVSKGELNTNTSANGVQYATKNQTQLPQKFSARALVNLTDELK